jgi:hypothetical protein
VSDPVSWLLIEPGWEVYGSDGERIGTVDETVGDSTDDIFNGLAIVSGPFAKSRYVPAEQVAGITDGRVELRIPSDAADSLAEYEEPPTTAEILPESASAFERVETASIDPLRSRETDVPLLRRIWVRLLDLFGGRGR